MIARLMVHDGGTASMGQVAQDLGKHVYNACKLENVDLPVLVSENDSRVAHHN